MASTLTEHTAAAAGSPRNTWFRGDVDGLRAIAIVLVVGYHAGLPFFGGGFIGVDVFFVISGFLISRNLVRESESSERVALGGFWSRRIRRLVPALALVVTTTLIVGSFVLPAFDLEAFARQGASAALYVSNMLFASESQNYFAADVSTSPFLHTWSLGVEEQFYLVWPVVFALVCWSQRNRLAAFAAQRRRQVLTAVFGVTLVASLALSVTLTASGSTWAFFGLPSRAWEFAAAGLLAVLPVPSVLRRTALRTVLAVGGLVVLAIGCALIDDATAYPGLWALLPVVGTVLIIVAGETWDGTRTPTLVSRALSTPPLQWLGRVSYSWYLWHWPAIVLTVVVVEDDAVRPKTLAALASLPVAWAAYRFFETPLRFSPLIAKSHRRTYLAGALATIAVLLVAGAVWANAPHLSASASDGLSAPPGSSLEDRVAYGISLYRSRSDNSCPVVGALETVDGDKYCVGGDPAGDRSVMLLGDSHAGQWRTALDSVARANGVKLLIRQHNGCAPFKVLLDEGKGAGAGDKAIICPKQQAGDLRVLDALQPDAVIVANWAGTSARVLDQNGAIAPPDQRLEIWRQSTSDLVGEIQRRGIAVGWILDEPTIDKDASKCVVAKQEVAACEPDRATGLKVSAPALDAERSVLADHGITTVIDMTDVVCDESRCRLEIDGDLVYVDEHHLTDAFAAQQAPRLDALVRQLLGR